jgi:hypothetical protein
MTTLKAAAVLAVILLAGLGSLFVLDLIPRETLQDLTVKTVSLVGILAAASLTIGLLLKKPKA